MEGKGNQKGADKATRAGSDSHCIKQRRTDRSLPAEQDDHGAEETTGLPVVRAVGSTPQGSPSACRTGRGRGAGIPSSMQSRAMAARRRGDPFEESRRDALASLARVSMSVKSAGSLAARRSLR